MTLNEKLRRLMVQHELTQSAVSEYTQYSLNTVKAWLADPASERYREMKPRAMSLLELQLKTKKAAR